MDEKQDANTKENPELNENKKRERSAGDENPGRQSKKARHNVLDELWGSTKITQKIVVSEMEVIETGELSLSESTNVAHEKDIRVELEAK